jgi:hypothetical protein
MAILKKLRGPARREAQRKGIIGKEGVRQQDLRTTRPHKPAKEAVRRVGEYKAAKKVARKIDKSDGNNTYINRRKQDNPR